MEFKTCCFIGHRKINETQELKETLYRIIENLITNEKVKTFLFGSKSQFNTLCHNTVTKIKEQHPEIKRIYVRAEYPYIDQDYKSYLLENYEDTYYPETIINAGKAVYIKRNYELISKSDFCVIYFDEQNATYKSGTKIAHDYATKQAKNIIRIL
jgi:hypothetical protein